MSATQKTETRSNKTPLSNSYIGKTLKEIIKELCNYRLKKFTDYVEQTTHDNESLIINLINQSIIQPNIWHIHDIQRRSNRNKFFLKILDILRDNNLKESQNFLEGKIRIIQITESLFDKMVSILKECDIEKIPLERKIWAHISRAEKAYDEIRTEAEVMMESRISDKSSININEFDLLLTDDHGNEFSADSAIDKITTALSLTLKLLAYQNRLYKNDIIILPARVKGDDSDLIKASSTQHLAMSWSALEKISNLCLLFGGDVNKSLKDDIPSEIKEHINEMFNYTRDETAFEVYDSISNERLNRKILQNSFEMIHMPVIDEMVIDNLQEVKFLGDGHFLSKEEVSALHALKDIFCIDPVIDKTKYNGLTLFEWVRSYSCLRFISENSGDSSKGLIISNYELEKKLVQVGICNKSANLFIDLVSFGKDSRDLFDCPLLRINNNEIFILKFPLVASSITQILISRISSLQIKVDNKGYNFEKDTIKRILKVAGNCKSFKFKRGNDEYEYDAVFILDKRVFLLECKNRSLSGYNPVHAFRKKTFYEKTVSQVLRLKNALIKYPDVMEEQFDINISKYELIPVILNCMPFSWPGVYEGEGVYCTDASSLNRFFESNSINAISSEQIDGKRTLEKKSAYMLWSSSMPSSDDLIRQFENPIQLQDSLGSRQKEKIFFQSNNDTAFTVELFHTNQKKMIEAQKGIFQRASD